VGKGDKPEVSPEESEEEEVSTLKKILWSLLAALSTPEAIKAEKSLAVIVLARAAILVPSAAFLINALVKYLGG